MLALDTQLESAGEYERTGTTQVVLKSNALPPPRAPTQIVFDPASLTPQNLHSKPKTVNKTLQTKTR